MLNHSNLASCMFMAPKRQEEENEILIDGRVRWTYIPRKIPREETLDSSSFLNISQRMESYTMKVNPGLSEAGSNLQKRDIEIPFIYLKRKNARFTMILLHANAEDIFGIEYLGDELRANFRVN